MTGPALAVHGVTRQFRNGAGVFDLEFELRTGQIIALVGLNGAEKSTMMRILLGMLRPDRGEVRLAGQPLDAASREQWARVGHLVEYPLAYPELTVRRNLQLSARMRGVNDVDAAMTAVITEFALQEYTQRRARTLSLGNRQRVGLAAALQHDPAVIVLDEPTNALDPAGVIRLRESLLRRADAGAAILVSSHHLDEVARIADRIAVINRGCLIGDLDPATHDIEHGFFEIVRIDDERAVRMRPAVWAEAVKLTGSTVGRVGSIAIVAGISLLSGAMMLAAASGDPQLLAKLGPAATHDWTGFLLASAQITGAGGLLGFGVVLSWMFGREFGDGTITGLFALPVRRSTIALAKLLIYAVWAIAISVCLAALLVIVGLVAGLGPLTADTWTAVARQIALTVMTAAIAAPVAWAATLGRSVLAGVSVSIGVVVVAQVSVLAGLGGWMPLASPALWAISSGEGVTGSQLLLVVPYFAACVLVTAYAWRTLQLDR